MASKKDGDVEAVGKLAKQTSPEQLAEIDALLADYRARRAAEKRAAADAARVRLAQAKFWQNWTGEGQIAASQGSGNTDSTGLRLGIARNRKGADWNPRVLTKVGYPTTNTQNKHQKMIRANAQQTRP